MKRPNFDLMFEEGQGGHIRVEVQDLEEQRRKRRRGGAILGFQNL